MRHDTNHTIRRISLITTEIRWRGWRNSLPHQQKISFHSQRHHHGHMLSHTDCLRCRLRVRICSPLHQRTTGHLSTRVPQSSWVSATTDSHLLRQLHSHSNSQRHLQNATLQVHRSTLPLDPMQSPSSHIQSCLSRRFRNRCRLPHENAASKENHLLLRPPRPPTRERSPPSKAKQLTLR